MKNSKETEKKKKGQNSMLEGRNKVPRETTVLDISMAGFTCVPFTLKQKMLSGEDKPLQHCYKLLRWIQMSRDGDMNKLLMIKNS